MSQQPGRAAGRPVQTGTRKRSGGGTTLNGTNANMPLDDRADAAPDEYGERDALPEATLTTPIRRPSRRPAPRRARLTLTRIDPWSVLKASLVFTSCLLVVWMIAVIVLFGILSGAGVFDSVNSTLSDVLGTSVNFNGLFIIGGALLLGAFNVVLMSALATVAAFAYNITVGLIGGLDVTLAERE